MNHEHLAVLDWRTDEGVQTIPARQPAHSPDSPWITTADGHAVTIGNRPAGSAVFTLPPEPADISRMAWSPGRRWLAVAYADGGVAVWDIDQIYARFAGLGIDPQEDVAAPTE